MKPSWHFYALLIVLGAMVHAGVLAVVHAREGSIDAYAFKSLDAKEYWQLGVNLATQGRFSQETEAPFKADTWRTPGYPFALAVILRIVGPSPKAVLIAQQMLSILNVCLLFGIARSFMSDRRALVAALLFLVEPYQLYYSLWLLATTLFVTILLLTWLFWQRTLTSRPWRCVVLLGWACGLLVLVRPIAGLIPIAIVVGLTVWALRGHAVHLREGLVPFQGTKVMLFAVMCAIPIGSWMGRNLHVSGHFELSDQSGVVLAYFKAAEVTLWREGRSADRFVETSLSAERRDHPHPTWEAIDRRLRDKMSDLPDEVRNELTWKNIAQGNKTTVDSFALSRELREIAAADLSASPISTLSCYLVRCASVLTFPLNLAAKPPNGPQPHRLYWLTQSLPYIALVVFVIVALVRTRPAFAYVYFPVACTVVLLLATTPQLDPRFRVPMIPMLLLIALLPKTRGCLSNSESAPTDTAN